VLIAAAALAASPPRKPDRAETTRQQLQQAEHDRAARVAAQQAAEARARAAQAEQRRLSAALITAAARLQDTEAQVADAAQRMDALERERAAAEAKLQQRAADLAPLLPLIERISLYPAETLLAVPAPPEQTVAGVLVLRGLSRELEHEAAMLRAQQDEVARLEAAIAAQAPALARAQAEQAQLAAGLDAQVRQTRQAERAATDAATTEARQAAADAARADSLRGVLAEIDAERKAAEARAQADAARAERQRRAADATAAKQREAALSVPAGPGLQAAQSQLNAPVAGAIARGFGEQTDAGPALGISYAAPPGARVVSPCAGKIVFGAPFRSYGLLLIIDCGGGYHFVLAGLDRLDVSVGLPVQAGEPVGVMPKWDPGTSGKRPALYVELRRDGQPINPAPWLRAKG
jgi:septal ring factor EnvC (AmiA/AmiB activator)